MGHPKAARRSHSQMLRNSRSESFDRIATFVDFGAHLLWSPPHSLQRACAAELAQGLVFCCACETMSQAYYCGSVTARSMLRHVLLQVLVLQRMFRCVVFSFLQFGPRPNRQNSCVAPTPAFCTLGSLAVADWRRAAGVVPDRTVGFTTRS